MHERQLQLKIVHGKLSLLVDRLSYSCRRAALWPFRQLRRIAWLEVQSAADQRLKLLGMQSGCQLGGAGGGGGTDQDQERVPLQLRFKY